MPEVPPPPSGNGIPSREWFRAVFGEHRAVQVGAVTVRLTKAERDALQRVGVTLPGMPGVGDTAARLVRDQLIALGELDPKELR